MQDFQELLGPAETRLLGARARSASDAAVLRRKGHLKEQARLRACCTISVWSTLRAWCTRCDIG